MIALIFLAMPARYHVLPISFQVWRFAVFDGSQNQRLQPLDLQEVELYRCLASEDRDRDLHLALFGVDLFDRAHEVGERAVDHAHALALLEPDLHARLIRPHLLHDRKHLGPVEWGRRGARADESRYSG